MDETGGIYGGTSGCLVDLLVEFLGDWMAVECWMANIFLGG